MKKFFTFFAATAAAVLALASCNKDDSVYENNFSMDNEINVSAMMAEDAIATKSSNAYTTTTDGLQSFNMFIYNGDTKIADNAKFVKPVGNAYWSDGNKYYWSEGATYSFVAYAIDDNFTSLKGINVEKDKVTLGLGVVNSNNCTYGTTTPKTGGIYAEGSVSDGTNQVDPVVAFATGTKDTKVTSLTFNHTLSRIRVVAKASISSKYKVQAKFLGYEFRGVYVAADAATFSKNEISWTPKTPAVAVFDNRFSASTTFAGSNGKDITNVKDYVALADNSWCNVIPGEKIAADQLVAKVALYDTVTGTLIGTRYLTASAPDPMSENYWVPSYDAGSQYTYYVDIADDGGKDTDDDDPDFDPEKLEIQIVTVEVSKWADVDGGTATFKRN